jgi:hypothetical protein
VSDILALRATFPVWDAVGHGTQRYVHDPDGVVHVPRQVALYLLHTGGYVIHDRPITSDEIEDGAAASEPAGDGW